MMTPLRGRVVIREDKSHSSIIEVVGVDPRSITTHRGMVIAVGAPVLTDSDAEIPLHFGPGDIVQFHFEATEKGRTTVWEGEPGILIMAQREIDAVIE